MIITYEQMLKDFPNQLIQIIKALRKSRSKNKHINASLLEYELRSFTTGRAIKPKDLFKPQPTIYVKKTYYSICASYKRFWTATDTIPHSTLVKNKKYL